MNVAIYLRVSTPEQKEHGYSLGEQQERLSAYCKAKGWRLVKTYEDGGYTGANLDRPAIQRLMHECGIYDLVLVWKLDRLSRSQKDTLSLIEHFKEQGTAFASMQENFDTSTAFGMAMVGILSVFAQLEREQIRERMMLGLDGRAKLGRWKGGGHPPIGYSYCQETGKLVPNDEADQVRLIYQKFLDGEPFSEITKYMHDRYTTRYGTYNSVETVKRILKNPAYIGCIKHNDTYLTDCHEPIIDKETFDAVQSVLQSRKNGNKNAAGRHLLTGMVFCECGKRMALNIGGGYKYFACWRKYSGNITEAKVPCNNRRIREDALNEAVKDSILSLKFKDLKPKKREKPTNTTAELAKIDRQIAKLIDLYTLDTIPIGEVKSRIESLEKKKALLTAPEAPVSDFRVQKDILSRAREAFENDDVTPARMTVDALIERITVRKDAIEIKWAFS